MLSLFLLPLLYDEDLLDIIQNVGRDEIEFSIVTNATKLGKLKSLAKAAPDLEITVSLPVPPDSKYEKTDQKITGSSNPQSDFRNIIEAVNYLKNKRRKSKINYVLCKDMNASAEYIKDIIEFTHESSIELRFLEMAINTTNADRSLNKYSLSQLEFEAILKEIYKRPQLIKSDERAFCTYTINNQNIKYIKFFCSDDCDSCPENKTSLWLTSTGEIKDCSYRSQATPIKNWKYPKIVRLLEENYGTK